MRETSDMDQSIKCTTSGCSCLGFEPGEVQSRSCDRCGHGWVTHALHKFQTQTSSRSSPVEVVLPGPVLDLSSLVLYGAQAVPVHLKILLDRLYSVLTAEQVGHILNTLGWSLGDYVRGYMLQSPSGKVLDCWTMVTPEEELLIVKQFLRFGETRSIVDLMTHHFLSAVNQKTCCSNTSLHPRRPEPIQDSREHCPLQGRTVLDCSDRAVGHFENFSGGLSLLLPFHFSASTFGHLVPSKVSPLTLSLQLQDLGETRLLRGLQQSREGSNSESGLQSGTEPLECLDFDKPNTPFPVPQNFRGSEDRVPSFSPRSFSAPRLSELTSSTCPLKNLQPLHQSSISPYCSPTSTLQPLPPSCSLPSAPSGGRKGRVCCGVCGKSFYDKGTLKIHYNAVHLKIKHGCTVAGCTMVFSSLRSRNRHSANPNPRLHGSGPRTDVGTHKKLEFVPRTPGETTSPAPQSKTLTWNNSFNLRLPPLPPPSPDVEEEHLVNINTDELISETPSNIRAEGGSNTVTNQQHQLESGDYAPKKKPRKLSKPVKIAREEVKGRSIKKEQEF